MIEAATRALELQAITGPFQIGRFTLHLISDGWLRLTGQSMFRTHEQVADDPPPDPRTERPEGETRRTGRTLVGLNALLITDGDSSILIDTGIGEKHEVHGGRNYDWESPRRLLEGLETLGYAPSDIDHVINTHLHFDHCGGNTKFDATEQLVPTFSRAIYHVSRGEYECALEPPPRERKSIPLDNILPVQHAGQLELWDHDGEILPGIFVHTTGGHTRDHSIIIIRDGGKTACFLADLIPTASHLHPTLVMKYDLFPDQVKRAKRELLEVAACEQWLLLFDHAPRIRAGTVEHTNGRFHFKATGTDSAKEK